MPSDVAGFAASVGRGIMSGFGVKMRRELPQWGVLWHLGVGVFAAVLKFCTWLFLGTKMLEARLIFLGTKFEHFMGLFISWNNERMCYFSK